MPDQTIPLAHIVAQMIRPRPCHRLLVAYDELMNESVIRERCPDPEFVTTARIPSPRFIVNSDGLASIVPRRDFTGHGVIWEIDDVATACLAQGRAFTGIERDLLDSELHGTDRPIDPETMALPLFLVTTPIHPIIRVPSPGERETDRHDSRIASRATMRTEMRNFLQFFALLSGLILAVQVAGLIFGAPASELAPEQAERVEWAKWARGLMHK